MEDINISGCKPLLGQDQSIKMSPTPQWVKDLKPSPPQGSDLLAAERQKSKVSVEKLSSFLFTKEVLERQDRILKILQAEKIFDKSQNYFDGRVDRFQTSLARAKRLRQLQVQHNWDREEYMCANELISEPTPYGLHASMYLVCMNEPFHDKMLTCLLQTTLRDQGTPEQHKLFLEPAENYKAIGCYAQTEVN
jgi:acyl-CoA oxidase